MRNAQGKASEGKEGGERRTYTGRVEERGNLCHSDLSLCHAGGAQGFPSAWAERQPGPV